VNKCSVLNDLDYCLFCKCDTLCLLRRFKGGYDIISRPGSIRTALVDFTGGIPESIDLKEKRCSPNERVRDDLYNLMSAMANKRFMMACGIPVIINSLCQS